MMETEKPNMSVGTLIYLRPCPAQPRIFGRALGPFTRILPTHAHARQHKDAGVFVPEGRNEGSQA